MNNDELYHYGVLGMRWGFRKDDSKSSGRIRRGAKKAAKAIRSAPSNIRSYKNKRATRSRDVYRVSKRLSKMSDQELDAFIKRLDIEKRILSDIRGNYNKNNGHPFLKKVGNDFIYQPIKEVGSTMVRKAISPVSIEDMVADDAKYYSNLVKLENSKKVLEDLKKSRKAQEEADVAKDIFQRSSDWEVLTRDSNGQYVSTSSDYYNQHANSGKQAFQYLLPESQVLLLPSSEYKVKHSAINDELCHYGVKGMRWGFRKDESKSSSWMINSLKTKMKKIFGKSKKSYRSMFRRMNNQQFQQQILNQQIMDMTTRESINSGLMTCSLAATGGMNPYSFGMM